MARRRVRSPISRESHNNILRANERRRGEGDQRIPLTKTERARLEAEDKLRADLGWKPRRKQHGLSGVVESGNGHWVIRDKEQT